VAVHCRLGRLPDLNPRLQVYSLESLPRSHHCSQESSLLPGAITAPRKTLTAENFPYVNNIEPTEHNFNKECFLLLLGRILHRIGPDTSKYIFFK
jgi:hypothetical protein